MLLELLFYLALVAIGTGGVAVTVARHRNKMAATVPEIAPVVKVAGTENQAFSFGIVGEAERRQDIALLASGGETNFAGTLLVEGDTVSVFITHVHVGQLAKQKGAEFIKALAAQGFAGKEVQVAAKLMGGHKLPSGAVGNYGVKLDMAWPPVFGVGKPSVPVSPQPTSR